MSHTSTYNRIVAWRPIIACAIIWGLVVYVVFWGQG